MHLWSAVNQREERIGNYEGRTIYIIHLDLKLSHMQDSHGMNGVREELVYPGQPNRAQIDSEGLLNEISFPRLWQRAMILFLSLLVEVRGDLLSLPGKEWSKLRLSSKRGYDCYHGRTWLKQSCVLQSEPEGPVSQAPQVNCQLWMTDWITGKEKWGRPVILGEQDKSNVISLSRRE